MHKIVYCNKNENYRKYYNNGKSVDDGMCGSNSMCLSKEIRINKFRKKK